jgi:hypothetical protein
MRSERDIVESWTDRRMRVRLTTLINLCAGLGFDDHPVSTVLRCFGQLESCVSDPAQVRSGSDFEARALACAAGLRPIIGEMSARPIEAVPFDEQDGALEPLLAIPPWTILGEAGPDCYFNLICWNEANALAEGMQRPYRAASRISAEGFHEPTDAFGLVAPMAELTERYEDHPAERDGTAAEIVRVLDDFRAHAPWPITE